MDVHAEEVHIGVDKFFAKKIETEVFDFGALAVPLVLALRGGEFIAGVGEFLLGHFDEVVDFGDSPFDLSETELELFARLGEIVDVRLEGFADLADSLDESPLSLGDGEYHDEGDFFFGLTTFEVDEVIMDDETLEADTFGGDEGISLADSEYSSFEFEDFAGVDCAGEEIDAGVLRGDDSLEHDDECFFFDEFISE